MVSKLLKHEIKNTWKEVVFINGVLLGIALVFGFFSLITSSSDGISWFKSLLFLVFIIGLCISFGVLIINIIKSFNRKMFSDEGYLTLTLPLTIDQILIPKILVNMLWIFVTFVVYYLCLIIIINPMPDDFVNVIGRNLDKLFSSPIYALIYIIWVVITLSTTVLILLLTLSLLNIGKFRKNRLLIGIAIFFGLSILTNIIEGMLSIQNFVIEAKGSSIIITNDSQNPLQFLGSMLGMYISINSIVTYILVSVLFYLISRNLIKNKLEL